MLSKYYVEPKCQQLNPADYDEDEPSLPVRSPVFETINEFFNKEFKTPDPGGKNQMFVLSDAGMGKTSLLMMIKMMHLMSFWPSGYECILLKLGPETIGEINEITERAKTVLLLDALDEDPTAWGKVEERLIELLTETSNFRRVIISCRTQFFPEKGKDPFCRPGWVEVGGSLCPMIFMSLFDDAQVEKYLKKRFPRRWKDLLLRRDNLSKTRAEELIGKMASLRSRPLLLAYIDDILDAGIENLNEYSVYNSLVESWLLREERKSRKMKIGSRPSKESLLEACMIIAEKMQSDGTRFIREKQLKEMMETRRELKQLEMIDVGGRSLLNRNSDGDFRFSHYSIQEFMIVRGAVEGRLSRNGKKLRTTDQMLDFLLCAPGDDIFDFFDIGQMGRKKFINRNVKMIKIKGGSFIMGDKGDEKISVSVDDFLMAEFPVTQLIYRLVTGENPSGFKGKLRPVENVSWDDAVRFCNMLSELMDLKPVYEIKGRDVKWIEEADGFRLPTEAEWQYACQAGSKRDRYGKLDDIAWYSENSNKQTHAVGKKKSNDYGLYDMLGNVYEWCWDWYGKLTAVSDNRNPKGPETGSLRVIRGGAWLGVALDCRCSYRFVFSAPSDRGDGLGFRLSRSLP